jgi:hypothetical protein
MRITCPQPKTTKRRVPALGRKLNYECVAKKTQIAVNFTYQKRWVVWIVSAAALYDLARWESTARAELSNSLHRFLHQNALSNVSVGRGVDVFGRPVNVLKVTHNFIYRFFV